MARRRQGNDDGGWHLDKKVPLALIFAMLIQAAGVIAWASSATGSINTLIRDVAVLTANDKERGVKLEEVISLKVEVRHINDSIARIEAALGKALSFGRSAASEAEENPYPRPRASAR